MNGDSMLAWAVSGPAELKALSDPIGVGVLILEHCEAERFRILSANRSLETLTGLSHVALSGLFLERILPAFKLAAIVEQCQQCVEQGKRAEFISEIELPLGKLWWQISLNPITDHRGEVVRVLASIVDFTGRHTLEAELRQAASKLQESQSRLEWAVVGGEIGVWEWDIKRKQIWMSDPWPAHLKAVLSTEAMPVDDWMKLIHSDDQAHALATAQQAVNGDIPAYSMEYQVRLLSGEWQWRHVYGTITARNEKGKALRIGGTYQNVTQQKQAQEELRKVTLELQYRASHDGLTKALNRGAIIEALESEIDRAHREGTNLTVALLDVDHFKTINDRYGHLIGDQILVAIVERIRTVLRGYDYIGRFGGEEFLVIAPARDKIEDLPERIRRVIADTSFDTPIATLHITGSIGVATCGSDLQNAKTLLAAADEALYRAKQRGRNQVAQADCTGS